MSDTAGQNLALMPDRHPQHDLFICDVADAILKDVMPQMEHPFYSLSKKPETTVRMYRNGDQWLKVTPSVNGLATIYDKDILIYCISQIMAKLKTGEKVSKRVRINSRDLLVFTNRGTAGKDYDALQDAIERIRGTTITTNIRTGDEEQTDTFGLIDASSIRRKHGLDGRLQSCEITLSDWVFNAIEHNEVLTLHRDYFRLRKPIERRIYELGRKHCGQQPSFKISLEQLHKKSGSKSTDFEFRRAVRSLATSDHLPDYRVEFDAKADMVMFINRNTMKIGTGEEEDEPWAGALRPDYDAIRAAAPGWDPRYLEEQFRAWLTKKERIPKQPEKMFIKFATTWFSNNGRPR